MIELAADMCLENAFHGFDIHNASAITSSIQQRAANKIDHIFVFPRPLSILGKEIDRGNPAHLFL